MSGERYYDEQVKLEGELESQRASVTIKCLYAWGGQSRFHDYEMSDGSIRTLHDTEAPKFRAPR